MERNSLIPWRYSRWNATFMGLVFIGFGLVSYLKDNHQFHFYQVIFFAFGIGYIIYAWSALYDKWRRRRGYYEEANPPLVYNLFQMLGQIVAFAGILSYTFVSRDVALSLMLGGLALITIGGASLFIGGNRKEI